ncbi:MAG: hypothetical protein ABJE95_40050 [Byssovorax sp.]
MKTAPSVLLVAALTAILIACTPNVAPAGPTAPSAGDEGCAAACARIQTCAGEPIPSCQADCTVDLTTASAAQAYQACVASLDCVAIQRSLVMNEGPLGRCFKSAMGH